MARRTRHAWRNTSTRALAVPGLGLIRPGEAAIGAGSGDVDALAAAGALIREPAPVDPVPVAPAAPVDHVAPEEAA